MEKNIKLSLETARKIYPSSPKEMQIALEETFGKAVLYPEICDRIQTLSDVYEITGGPYNYRAVGANSADSVIAEITSAYNEGVKLDWDNPNQYKYYLYFVRKNGEWVLCAVHVDSDYACLGSGHYFTSEENARDAYSKFKYVWDKYLPK